MTYAHANSAAAARALQHHGIPETPGLRQCIFEIGEQTRSRQQRDAAGLRGCAGGMFQGKRLDMLRGRSNEADASRSALAGELNVFAKEAVAGVNRLRPRLFSGRKDGIKREIA